MKILLDQDQVLCQWTERVLEWFNRDYGTSIKITDVKDWGLAKTLGPAGRDFIRSCMRWPEFYTRLDPVPGAIEGTEWLLNRGHEVRIVTAVPASAGIAYHGKQQWLRDRMPFFELDWFVAHQLKWEVEGDLLLDDGPHNIKGFMERNRKVAVFDCPWNKDVVGTWRVRDWQHFKELIRHLEEEKEIQDELESKRAHSMFDEAFQVR